MPDRPLNASFERPVKARLVVKPEYGPEWNATADDLERFGYVHQQDTYMRVHDMLTEALGIADFDQLPEDSPALAVRYLIECGICYDHSPWAREDGTPWDPEDQDHGNRVKTAIRKALMGDDE